MTPDETDLHQGDCTDLLVEVSDGALETACCRSTRRSPAEDTAADRRELRPRRSVYDGDGEYEFAMARHYVPRYSPRGGARNG